MIYIQQSNMEKAVVLENIRSAYNVWNIIRTADAFGYNVIISWYTPSPDNIKVLKTSLWAEKTVGIKTFYNPKKAIKFVKNNYSLVIWAEITPNAIDLQEWKKIIIENNINSFAIVFWNEVSWITKETLNMVDKIFYIPMIWKKESLNVAQASAIFMYELA